MSMHASSQTRLRVVDLAVCFDFFGTTLSLYMTGAFLWRAMHLSRLTQNSLLVARIRPSDD